ncbi:type VI secretion system Vgr family protein [Aquimarina rhabdastrellae]
MIEPKTTISIDGEFLKNFEYVALSQAINEHHSFEIVIDYDTIESQGTHTLEKSKKWLTKPAVINFDEKEFLGIITNIQLQHENGFNGKLILSGFSKTILLESGKHMFSWLDKDLTSIIRETVTASGIEATIAPVFKKSIEYQVQYQESHFEFIQRLAKQYNEWLYYDGIKLIFGKPTLAPAIPIEYGKDIYNINIGIQALPSSYSHFSYNNLDDKQNQAATKDAISGLNELGTFAFDTSNQLFGIKPNRYTSARVKDKSEIETILKNKQASTASNVNVITAKSNTQGLTVGSVIKISSARYENGDFEEKKYGEYIIIKIIHEASGSHEYSNYFEAIPAGVEVLPEPEVALPNAQPQIATVLSNDDPKKKGRIQVQFQWQTGTLKTSWIRVMSPDAGKSDTVGTNRGFVHIPEVDDQVMIGFRYNDPNRPFVMGSLFSGSTGAGGSDGNKVKSLTTRSGSTIIFDDDEGNITIKDADNNTMCYDGKGLISLTANKTISLTVGESSLVMKSDGTIDLSGNKITVTGKETITDTSEKIEIKGTDQVAVSSNKKVEINSANEASMTGTAKSTVSSSGTTSVEGTIIKLN